MITLFVASRVHSTSSAQSVERMWAALVEFWYLDSNPIDDKKLIRPNFFVKTIPLNEPVFLHQDCINCILPVPSFLFVTFKNVGYFNESITIPHYTPSLPLYNLIRMFMYYVPFLIPNVLSLSNCQVKEQWGLF
jgi:hypothetical protein